MARRVLIIGVALAVLASPAAAQLKAKRRELSRIQGELRQTLKALETLRDAERALGEDVKGLEHRDVQSKQRADKLQEDIHRVESRRAALKARLDAARSVSGFWAAAIASESARRHEALASNLDVYGTPQLWADEFRRAALIEKARHLRGLQGFRRKTERDEAEIRRRALELNEDHRRVREQREGQRQEFAQKKAALEEAQAKVASAARRARELEESARALTSLLDRLGKAGRYQKSGSLVRLDVPNHSLPWPVPGRVLRPFGRERDPELGTWTVRQGTLIASASGASVGAVAAGRVIFSGEFRSYGRVVIVDHGGSFFSVYGELGDIAKKKGDSVREGEMLAHAGPSQDGGGLVYLEIRRGTEALDPADWLEKK